jgi:hypothetical protein
VKTKKRDKEELHLDLIQLKPKRVEVLRFKMQPTATLGDIGDAETYLNNLAGKGMFEFKPIWVKKETK